MPRLDTIVRQPVARPTSCGHDATVFTAANGYLAVRGTHPELADGLPGVYLAGLFTDDARGFRTLVSCGDVLGVSLTVNGKALTHRDATVTHNERQFDLRKYLVTRTTTWQISRTTQLTVTTQHTCSLADRRLIMQRYQVQSTGSPVNVKLTARVTLRAKTRGEDLLAGFRSTASAGEVATLAQTRTREHGIAQHSCVVVDGAANAKCRAKRAGGTWELQTTLKPGRPLTLDKFVAYATDRDTGEDHAASATSAAQLAAQRGFTAMLGRHTRAWRQLWRDCDIQIIGDDDNALALQYTIAQLMAHTPRDDDRAGLGAKPLCAEGYRGHTFWDTDLFMTPAVTALRPDLGYHLANYRYETLDGARRNAARFNFAGAWFPWESADDGTEVTPTYWLHPDGRRMPITCWQYEIHSICDVAYAAWDFSLSTGDREWLFTKGVEVLLETARHWASRAKYNARQKRFEIHDVCGPDEGHERTNNCAFINVLAAWNIDRARATLDMLKSERPAAYAELVARLGLDQRELAHIRRVGRLMYIPQDRKTGWYRQFDGFEDLLFVDPNSAAERYEQPLAVEETQAVKQADVVMLLYLLRDRLTRPQMLTNWDYYVPRTAHGTSLSAATHAAVAARIGLTKAARQFFTQSANMDLLNWRGDSDRGLHGAAMGGTICAALFGFGGLVFHEDHLSVDPILPAEWQRLRIPFTYQGRKLLLDITHTGFELTFRESGTPITVTTATRRHHLTPTRPLKGRLARLCGTTSSELKRR
ncbi:MAG: glycoside hydrolase family 65 protein [Phycisphaerae bacterium]|nr:glycoside hydrolase family 65 protein [Phycisphaerae bacterium]